MLHLVTCHTPQYPTGVLSFIAKNKIFLSAGSTLLWGEILTCGRKLRNETFAFSRYHNLTEIVKNGKLVVKENLLLQPAKRQVSMLGNMEGFTHQSSLLFIDDTIKVSDLVRQLNELLLAGEVCFGVSALPVNGVVVRMLGYKAEQLYDLHKTIEQCLIKPLKATAIV